jgi:alkylation response protein AidB-like acyl-CoA dehydrogenase
MTTLLALPTVRLDRLDAVRATLEVRAAEHDADASFPFDEIAEVHAAGLLTASVGRRFGGEGLGLTSAVQILRPLGYGDPAVALISAMTLFSHAAQDFYGAWPDHVYREVLAESGERPVLLNALRVEPDLGTPARGGLPATIARRVGDHWSLSGRKIFSTGAPGLRWMIVWARTDEDPIRVGGFLVRADSPGIRIEQTWNHLGLRASRSDDVVLTDAEIPLGATVGLRRADDTAPREDALVAWNCLGLTALYLGVADAARDWLIRFLHERTPSALGAPLSTLPRFQSAVGEIEAALLGAGELLSALAGRVDRGDPDLESSLLAAKLLGTRAAITAVEQAVALVGNNGLTYANPLQRHFRNVLCCRIHTPQDDSILGAVGRAALVTKG